MDSPTDITFAAEMVGDDTQVYDRAEIEAALAAAPAADAPKRPALTEEQERALRTIQDAIDAALAEDRFYGGTQVLLQGFAGTGKAQPLDSKILTPAGWRRMGDMQIGDEVVAADGSISRVVGVYPQGVQPVYELTFSDGRTARSTPDHLWKFWNFRKWYVKPLSEIIEYMAWKARPERFAIPLCSPFLGGDAADLPIDPYLLGALIGDGGMTSRTIKFSSRDEQLIAEVRDRLPSGHTIRKLDGENCDWAILSGTVGGQHVATDSLYMRLKGLGLAVGCAEKRIPSTYKSASAEQRLELLRGLMDTDGTADTKTGTPSFTTVSHDLAKDVQELFWSLGAEASITEKVPTYTHNGEKRTGRTAYTVWVRHPDRAQFFRLERKRALASKSYQYGHRLNLKITDIRRVEDAECQCIAIDHPEHLYVTDNYVVTHNTFTVQELVRRNLRLPIVLCAPTNKAVKVLRQKNLEAGLETDCMTIYKLLGVKPGNNDEKRTLKKDGQDNAHHYRIVVIDECSMLGSEIMSYVQKALRHHIVIYIGDPMQLPPVGEELSDSFRLQKKAILNTIMRQRDQNPIIALTADIRSMIDAGEPRWDAFQPAAGSDGSGIFMAEGHMEDWMLDGFLSEEFKRDNDNFRYLAWTNATVSNVNRFVRAAVYGRGADPYVVGERLLFRKPVLHTVAGRVTTLFSTDEEAVIQNTEIVQHRKGVKCWKLTMLSDEGTRGDAFLVHEDGLQLYRDWEAELKNDARKDRSKWPDYFFFVESFAEAQPVYAMTVHRSQGSTFDSVFVDLVDIRKNRNTIEMLKLLYVAASRPRRFLVI